MHFHFAGDGNGDRQVEVPGDIRMQSTPGVRHKSAGRNDGMGVRRKKCAEAAGARRTWNFKSSISIFHRSGFFKIPLLPCCFSNLRGGKYEDDNLFRILTFRRKVEGNFLRRALLFSSKT